MDNKNIGEEGLFIFSDCGMIISPSSEELAEIAYESSKTFKNFIDKVPKIAFLSHSTHGSSTHEEVLKVRKAADIFKEKYPNILADGEMQLDTAIVPEIAERKYPTSKIKGDANILIFPNLDAGNIGYKLVERLGNAKAYGPITQGIKKPINDLSRGCNELDIVGVIAITCVQALER